MIEKFKKRIKQSIAFALIITLIMPHTVLASESLWDDLSEIEPLNYYLSDFSEEIDHADLRIISLMSRVSEQDTLTAEEQSILAEHLGMDAVDPLAVPSPEVINEFLHTQLKTYRDTLESQSIYYQSESQINGFSTPSERTLQPNFFDLALNLQAQEQNDTHEIHSPFDAELEFGDFLVDDSDFTGLTPMAVSLMILTTIARLTSNLICRLPQLIR